MPRTISLFCLLSLPMLPACGDSAPQKYTHSGSLPFELMIPSDYTARAEKNEGEWTSVVINPESGMPDLLVTWHPGWSYDEFLAWFNDTQAALGDVAVFEKGELQNGVVVHYRKGSQEYVKAVVRCQDTALQCMATIPDSVEDSGARNRAVDACKTISCP